MVKKHNVLHIRDKKTKVIKADIEFITIEEGKQRLKDMLKGK